MALCISKTLLDSVFSGHDSVKHVLQNIMYKHTPPGTRIIAKPMRQRIDGKVQLYPQLCDYYEVPEHAPDCAALRHPGYRDAHNARKRGWEAKGFNFVACTSSATDPDCDCFRSEDRLHISGTQMTQNSRDEWLRRAKIVIPTSRIATDSVVKCDTPAEDIAFIQYFRDVLGHTLTDVVGNQKGLIWTYHPRYNAAKIVRGSQVTYPSGVAQNWMKDRTDASNHQKELRDNPDAVIGQMDYLVPEQGVGGNRVSGRKRVEETLSERQRPVDMPLGVISEPVGDDSLGLTSKAFKKAIEDMQQARRKRQRRVTHE